MKRKEGFYWVNLAGDWQVMEYGDSKWFAAGLDNEIYLEDCDLYEIDEHQIINPNE